jgi:hypothetical protein
LFLAASKVARREGIPRIYFAAISGARIEIASEVKTLLQVSWVDPSDPVKGFNCLVISQSDAESIKDSISTGRVLENGMIEIRSIIGACHGVGAENLMESGLIAGESSAAYEPFLSPMSQHGQSVLEATWYIFGSRLSRRKTLRHISHRFLSSKHSSWSRRLPEEWPAWWYEDYASEWNSAPGLSRRSSWNYNSPRLAELCASCAWTIFTDN